MVAGGASGSSPGPAATLCLGTAVAFAAWHRKLLLRSRRQIERARVPKTPSQSRIVAKSMKKNPADRYAKAQDLADDLRRFTKDESIKAKRAGALVQLRKWTRRALRGYRRRRRRQVRPSGATLPISASSVVEGSGTKCEVAYSYAAMPI